VALSFRTSAAVAATIIACGVTSCAAVSQVSGAEVASIKESLFTGDAFEGTFVQPLNSHREWTVSRWREEFVKLRRVGVNTLVVQWSRFDKTDFLSSPKETASPLDRIMQAAGETGLEVFIGLSLSRGWADRNAIKEAQIERELLANRKIANEILSRFGTKRSFVGWYIPHEITDIGYSDLQRELILYFLRELSAALHRMAPLKPVMLSGYTDPEKSDGVRFRLWWNRIFEESGVDIVAFQDGAGIAGRKDWRSVLPYVKALGMLAEDFKGDVWLIAEVFSQTDGPPLNDKPFQAIPADIERVREQIEALGSYGRKLLAYSFFPYVLSSDDPNAKQLYDAYEAYLAKKLIPSSK
jgi:uncharacterized protein DUF4434